MAKAETTTEGPKEFKACHRYAGMAERKARRIIDVIRGRNVNQALADLGHDKHRAAPAVRKVLASAVANALQDPSVRASRLVVARAFVQGGPLLQGRMRFRPGPMGRAMPIRKRTCHIHVCVADPDVMQGAVAAPTAVEPEPPGDEASSMQEPKPTEPAAKPARGRKPRAKKAKKESDD